MADGGIHIVVIATMADLPANRMARVEIIGRSRPVRRPELRALLYGRSKAVTQWGPRSLTWTDRAGLDVCGLVQATPDTAQTRGMRG